MIDKLTLCLLYYITVNKTYTIMHQYTITLETRGTDRGTDCVYIWTDKGKYSQCL